MIRLVLRVLVARGCGGRRPTLTVTGFDTGRNARPAPRKFGGVCSLGPAEFSWYLVL